MKKTHQRNGYKQEQVLADVNVKVKFQAVSRGSSDENIQMMMAGGTAPDIILTYDRTIFGSFAKDGGLTDLTKSLAANGDALNKELSEIMQVGNLDGVQYAIPAKRSFQKIKHVGMIRKDWLDALGLDIPKTKAELIAALYAFKEQDPGKLGDKLVPWSMSGNETSEKMYLNFVASYVGTQTEEDKYLYSSWTKALEPGAVEGFKELNKLYNDGIISKDFAVDTDSSIYDQSITNAYAGFFLDDEFRQMPAIATAMELDPKVNYVAVNAFESENGEYINPANALYGAYIMIPKTSEKKVDAAMKYLNWIVDPKNAIKVYYSPDYVEDENGLPVVLTEAQIEEKGYALTTADLTIANQSWDFYKDPEKLIKYHTTAMPAFSEEYIKSVLDAVTTGIYNEPVIDQILEAESTYSANVQASTVIYAYNLISAAPGTFDAVQKAKYAELEQAGLNKILDARATYYKENVAK